MKQNLNQQMIEIAEQHGMGAKLNLIGGVDILIPQFKMDENGQRIWSDLVVPVNNLLQLKIALGY